MKKTIFFNFFLLISINLLAYPIDPKPLRLLVENSDYIVVGYVKKITQKKVKNRYGSWITKTKAFIQIHEVLQGELEQNSVTIPFEPDMICPLPPKYKEKTRFLVFLSKDLKGRIFTYGLSYGAKELSTYRHLGVYKRLIKDMQTISLIKDETEKFTKTVDWLVRCTEDTITLWDGAYELSPKSHFMSYYKTSKWENFGFNLDNDQKERLKSALLNKENRLHYEDLGVIDLIHQDYADEIDKMIITFLRNIDDKSLTYAADFMQRLSRKNETQSYVIISKYERLYPINLDPKKIKELKSLINDFLAIIQ
jgi:hypothetical protein